ncbi:MAG: ChaN family lipoprotein [bacterium]
MKYLGIMCFFVLILTTQMLAQRQYKIYESATGKEINIKELAEKTLPKDVIFFGEFHDDSLVHVLEFEFLKAFYKKNANTDVSMEMFERDAQYYLDKYLKGEISEEDFKKDSRPWPNYESDYKPLVELAKEHKANVIASNVPRAYAASYSKGGMKSLKENPKYDQDWIAKEISFADNKSQDEKEVSYRKEFFGTMIPMMGEEKMEDLSSNEENTLQLYYGAQIIKDETMAESIFEHLQKNPGRKVIHYDGNFHSAKWQGTVNKLRVRSSEFGVAVIAPVYVEVGKEIVFNEEWKIEGDFIIALEQKPSEDYQNMMGGHMGGNYIISHKIEVELNTQTHTLVGKDELEFLSPIVTGASFKLSKDILQISISSAEGEIAVEIKDVDGEQEVIVSPIKSEVKKLIVQYEGEIYNQPNDRNLKQKHAYSSGMISSADGEGIYLPAGSFYPYTEDDMADFEVKVRTIPADMTVITSGVQSQINDSKGITMVYKTELPADNLTLVGGKYQVIDSVFDGKQFRVYLLKENASKGLYLKSMIDYYKYYTKLFGKYPYSNFSLVDNFFATGFGMPGYTLLSGKLLDMPWVVLSPGSLAHEFVHNWWGNSVYVNNKSGNWCEALTTFCSNYYYNVLVGKEPEALDWRKKALIAIENLPKVSNYPLEDFKYQANTDDAVIGYSKGGFLFYELYKAMGEEHFWNAIKTFNEKYSGKRASWLSLSMTFNGYAKKNQLEAPISKIFNQWLKNKEVPSIYLDSVEYDNGKITFSIMQTSNMYMVVPVKITTGKEVIWKNCTVDSESNSFNFEVDDIKRIEIDPEYQVLRRLNLWEIPYTFSQALNDNPLVIYPSGKSEQYKVGEEFVKMLNESGYKAEGKSFDDVTLSDWKERSIIVLGEEISNPFFQEFKGKYPEGINLNKNSLTVDGKDFKIDENLLMMNISHPKDDSKFATLIGFTALENAEQFRRLFHYMSYSMVMINKAKMGRPVVSKELFPKAPAESPMKWGN